MDLQTELIERKLAVTRVSCKFNRVKAIEQQDFHGRAARAVRHGKLGHASTTDNLSDDALIRRAVEAAQVETPQDLVFPAAASASHTHNAELLSMDEAALRDLARSLIRTIQRTQRDLAIELEVRRLNETVELRNSSGGHMQASRTWLEGEAWVERHRGDEVLVALDSFSTARLDDTPLDFARRMARRLRWAQTPIEPVAGRQSVIFSPTALASLIDPMLWAFNGAHAFQSNARGAKRRAGFATKLGKQVFDTQFSLYDDAAQPDRPCSTTVDHEGMPVARTPLVERGVVTGFYHNLVSAAQAGTRSTGHGFRELIDPPLPSPTNVVVAPGTVSLSDMLKNVERGLLIDLIGDSDSSIGLSGDFSRTIVLAYQIERGRVTGYVRGAGLSGDLYKSLQHIEALSCDGYWSGDIFAPYAQLGGVNLTV